MDQSEINRLLDAANQQVESIAKMSEQWSEISGESGDEDSPVQVSVGPYLNLTSITIKRQAMKLEPEDLSAALMEAYGRATEDAQEKISELSPDANGQAGAASPIPGMRIPEAKEIMNIVETSRSTGGSDPMASTAKALEGIRKMLGGG